MLADNYEQIEAFIFNLALVGLFILMIIAVHDVLSKNNVPKIGRVVAYSVLFFGALGFLAKGIIQLIWASNGIG